MKVIKKLLPLALSFAALQLVAAEARACSCVEGPVPVCAAYWRADAVFTGIITDIRKPSAPAPREPPTALLHFVIEESFRGVDGREVEVQTLSGTSCDIPFRKGERWLIYARRDERTGVLGAGPCVGHSLLEHAEEDLKYLRGLRQNKPEQTIQGRLLKGRYTPLPGAKVTVEGAGSRLEALTGAEGEFKFVLPQGGDYVLRAFVPFAAGVTPLGEYEDVKVDPTDELTTVEYRFSLPQGQCLFKKLDFYPVDLHATAVVSGRVLNAQGRPFAPAGYVYLVNAEDESDSRFEKIGSSGQFKFTEVAVGSYYLVINPYDRPPGESDAPYARTYYPGVPSSNEATLVTVVEGAKIDDIDFRLREPLRERVVTGKVVWPDGRAVPGADVSVYGGAQAMYIYKVVTDARGDFSLKLYGDFQYEIKADTRVLIIGTSGKIRVPSTGRPGPLTLTIKPY
jgi:hypothetical protein